QDDQWVVAAEFCLEPNPARSNALSQLLADGVRARERQCANVGIVGEVATDVGLTNHHLDNSVGQSCVSKRLYQSQRRTGCLRRRLDDDGVACGERWRHL